MRHDRLVRLIMWDVDRTLLVGGTVGFEAFVAAFTDLTGVAWSATVDAAGRTDRWIAAQAFAQHGIADPDLPAFFTRYAAQFAARDAELRERATLLPGVVELLAALAARPDVVQTLVTGNIAPVGVAKVAALDLARHLDTAVGGYGDEHGERPELVRSSRARAEAGYGPVGDSDVLVVGDTAHDVDAALANGVMAVGVATGRTTAAELRAAGAHHVFDDLGDTAAVLAVLAP